MKKPQTAAEKPLDTAKEKQEVTPKTTKAAPKAAAPASKKAETAAANTKAEISATPVKPKETTKKSNPKSTAAQKPETEAPHLTIAERVGLTAGDIWHYLSENGATPVSKLMDALTEDEKIIQRSIGWLAQEDKISIELENRVEIIALKA